MGESTNPRATLRFDDEYRQISRKLPSVGRWARLACRELDDALGTDRLRRVSVAAGAVVSVQLGLDDHISGNEYSLWRATNTNDAERLTIRRSGD